MAIPNRIMNRLKIMIDIVSLWMRSLMKSRDIPTWTAPSSLSLKVIGRDKFNASLPEGSL